MKEVRLAVLFLLFLVSNVFAAGFHSVPIGHRVYRVLANAETRGLVTKQMDVKPYSVAKVMELLSQIEEGSITTSERMEIEDIKEELSAAYGNTEYRTAKEILTNGSFRTAGKDGNVTAIGLKAETRQTAGSDFSSSFQNDSRNSLTAYIRGDLWNVLSYDMNLSLRVDKLNPNVFLFNDFSIDGDGFYWNITNAGEYQNSIPYDKLYTGLAMVPEIDSELFKGKLRLRFGSVRRDWGPGLNNLELSGSASTFPALEAQVDVAEWLHYSVLTGSLEKFMNQTICGRPWPSDYNTSDKSAYKYDNNFSAQRIEWNVTKKLTLSIYESVVWKKRFEIAYLLPVSVYMFDQNALGDLDNMLAGLDFSFTWPNVARFYGAIACTEMSTANPKKFFTHPRNILGYQAGVEVPLPGASFSALTFQATYLSPFFYSHYTNDKNPWGKEYNSRYVNKGFCLGYPLDPDTLELLLQYELGFGKGWTGRATAKYQARSAQYSPDAYGTTILTYMDYENTGSYASKDFFHNIWSHVASLELSVTKRLSAFPVEFTGGIRVEGDWTRAFTTTLSNGFNYGNTVLGDWNATTWGLYGSFGMSIYY